MKAQLEKLLLPSVQLQNCNSSLLHPYVAESPQSELPVTSKLQHRVAPAAVSLISEPELTSKVATTPAKEVNASEKSSGHLDGASTEMSSDETHNPSSGPSVNVAMTDTPGQVCPDTSKAPLKEPISSHTLASDSLPCDADQTETQQDPVAFLSIQSLITDLSQIDVSDRTFEVHEEPITPSSQTEQYSGILNVALDQTSNTISLSDLNGDQKTNEVLGSFSEKTSEYTLKGETMIACQSASRSTSLRLPDPNVCYLLWSIFQLVAPSRCSTAEDHSGQEDEPFFSTAERDAYGASALPAESAAAQPEPNSFCASRIPPRLHAILGEYEDDADKEIPISRATVIAEHLPARNDNQILIKEKLFWQPAILPTNSEALRTPIESLQELQEDVFDNLDVSNILRQFTNTPWLNALWETLDKAIEENDELSCTRIAEFLCHLIVTYSIYSDSLFSCTGDADGQQGLDPNDALVKLLSDEHYEHLFKAMEYESELRKHALEVRHVDFLKHASRFKEVICTSEPTFRTTCQIIYRLLYLRDVCLPRHLDEVAIQHLNEFINSGYSYLCHIIQTTPDSFETLKQIIPVDVAGAKFLLQLLSVLRSNSAFIIEKPKLFAAIQDKQVLEALEGYFTEECQAAIEHQRFVAEQRRRQLEADKKMAKIIEKDVQKLHRPYLLSQNCVTTETLPEIAVEILHHVVEYNPASLRNIILSQASARPDVAPSYWLALCEVFRKVDNEGVHTQLADIFRRLLDTSLMDTFKSEEFLSIFYDRGVIDVLIDHLLTPPPTSFKDLLPSESDKPPKYFLPNISLYCTTPEDLALTYKSFESSDAGENQPAPVGRTAAGPREPSSVSLDQTGPRTDLHPRPTTYPFPSKSPTSLASTEKESAELHALGYSADRRLTGSFRRHLSDPLKAPPAKRRASGALTAQAVGQRASQAQYCTPDESNASSVQSFFLQPEFEKPTSEYSDSPPGVSDEAFSGSPPPSELMHPNKLVASSSPKVMPNSAQDRSRLLKILQSLSKTIQEQLLITAKAQLSFVKCQISGILSFCVMKHNFKMRNKAVKHDLHLQFIQMSYYPIYDQFLAIHAVEFLRACLIAQTDFYAQAYVRNDIFTPLLYLLRYRVIPPKSRSEGSLLESVIFEFLTTIRLLSPSSASVALLLHTLFEKHSAEVDQLNSYYIENCDCFLFTRLRVQHNEVVQVAFEKKGPEDYWTGLPRKEERNSDGLQLHHQFDPSDRHGEDDSGPSWKKQQVLFNARKGPRKMLPESNPEYDRELQEAYFDLDDEDIVELNPSSGLSTNDNPGLDDDSAPLPSFNLPFRNYGSDSDDDDTDVPFFLKSASSAAPRDPTTTENGVEKQQHGPPSTPPQSQQLQ